MRSRERRINKTVLDQARACKFYNPPYGCDITKCYEVICKNKRCTLYVPKDKGAGGMHK